MLDLTIREAASAMRATVRGPSPEDPSLAAPLAEVSIDSRTLRPGQTFFAIRGDRFDGHEFTARALQSGASVLVVDHPVEAPPEFPQLVVRNTTNAIQQLARVVRRQWGKELVAITGSMGKTTTREFAARLLGSRFSVLQSQGNLNNHIGLPLTLLNLRREHDLAVVELGMNHPGEIDLLGSICLPTAALVTNVAPVHLEFFDSVDAIARAKGEILNHLPSSGRLFVNGGDLRLARVAERYSGERYTFGFDALDDYRVDDWSVDRLDSMTATISGPDFAIQTRLHCVGKHFLHNLIGAVSVAHSSGVGRSELEVAIPQLQALRGRGQIREQNGLFIWDDSYNSSPAAVEALLHTLCHVRGVNRIVLVLGTMLELGPKGPQFHREIGRKIPPPVQRLITVGTLADEIGRGALDSGFPQTGYRHCATAEEAAEVILQIVEPGDLVIVKGSRGVGLDRAVAALQGGPA